MAKAVEPYNYALEILITKSELEEKNGGFGHFHWFRLDKCFGLVSLNGLTTLVVFNSVLVICFKYFSLLSLTRMNV